MDIPIQISFFKKLELFQEMRRLDQQQRENRVSVWNLEKKILRWTVSNHHHLGTPLSETYVTDNILHELTPRVGTDRTQAVRVMENLIERGFAERPPGQSIDAIRIKFTRAGLLMGDVIDDVEGPAWWPRVKYDVFYWCVWIIVGAAVITAIGALLAAVWKVFSFLLWVFSGGHHWHHAAR